MDPVNLNPVNLNPVNLNHLKNEIITIPAHFPVLIYVGVGTASNTREHLPLEHYHQFPPFLQDMRNQLPGLHLFLLLLDPYQENPPYVATHYALQKKSEEHFSSLNGQLQTFVYRQAVYNDSDNNHPADAVNITETLRDLNKFAIEKRVSLLYHDFTGRRTGLIAEYFEKEIAGHLEQIVYGMSAREDHGCFFDLTRANAYFPFRLDQSNINLRPLVKLFNYYNYIVNHNYEKSAFELLNYPVEMHSLAVVQKNQIIHNIRSQFKNTNLPILRQLSKVIMDEKERELQADVTAAALVQQATYMFCDIPFPYRKIFVDLFIEKNYDLLYEIMVNYSSSELDILAKLKELDMSGEDILTFIMLDEDPYKWHNNANELL